MHTPETCIDCGKLSPPTNTEHTLTTSFGWRMTRRLADSGDMRSEWRCPACWAKHKAQRGIVGAVELGSMLPPKKKPSDPG